MAYILNKTDGTPLVTIPNKSTSGADYSVTFIGKNYVSYGEALNESLLHLLENSASDSAARPVNPVLGQTWYNKTDKTLYVCYQERTGGAAAQFRALANSNTGAGTPSNPATGDIWFDPTSSSSADPGSLKIYVGPPRGWVTVGPQVQSNWAQTDANQVDYIKNRPLVFEAALRVLYGNNEVTKQTTKTINFTGPGVTANLVNGTFDSVEVNVPGAASGARATVAVSSTAPANPTTGELWYENDTIGRAFIYDGSEWVDFSPAVGSGSTSAATPVSTVSPALTSSTSFTLATTDGSSKRMGIVLTPGTWQVILDTRIGSTTNYSGAFTATQSATVGSTTVATQVRVYNGASATQVSGTGLFKGAASAIADIVAQQLNKDIVNSTSDIAVADFTIAVDTAVIMEMQAVVVSDPIIQPTGSTLTLSKIASTDAQKLYSGTVPTFTVPPAAGLGVGQTWQNVKNSRVADRDYKNDTGAPIMVALSFYLQHDRTLSVYVDNLQILTTGSPADDSYHNLTFVVPNNSTYKVTKNGGDINIWAELR
jgi:hypothetical protein